jgi:hypothetical protein
MNDTARPPGESAWTPFLRALIPPLVFAPVFFQLDGRLYTDPATVEAPRGMVTNLPIPISVLVCAIAVAFMARRWLRDPLVLILISAVPLMFVTSLVAGDGAMSWTKSKLLLFQFALPMAGFAVGREIARDTDAVLRAGRWLLGLTVAVATAQLASTWFRHGSPLLVSDVFGIEIYGHLQYVPVLVMAAYVVGVFAVIGSPASSAKLRRAAMLFAPVMAMYVAASMSLTALLGFWMALLLLVALPVGRANRFVAAASLVVAVCLSAAYTVTATSRSAAFQAKFLGLSAEEALAASGKDVLQASSEDMPALPPGVDPELLPNVSERYVYWEYFVRNSTSSVRSFLFGHTEQPDIRVYPSAHNYYLDLLYNFGVLPLVPIAVVIASTLLYGLLSAGALRRSPALAGLAFITLLLLVIDNGLKVSMRQPYPGIATFLLWGMLSMQLEMHLLNRRVHYPAFLHRQRVRAEA